MTTNETIRSIRLPEEAEAILSSCPGYTVARNADDLIALSTKDAVNGIHEVAYEVPGKGRYVEAAVCRVKNGISANYTEPYMRRRDPDCMVIADDLPTDKPRFPEQYGTGFEELRRETFEWLSNQHLAMFCFDAGAGGVGTDSIVIAPSNAGFFALGLALLQGIIDPDTLPSRFEPKAVIYVAPPFRHTHFDGKQVVVHNRRPGLYEMFSYNLYPGPSAKKGVYGMLLTQGETEHWVTLHCSTVQVVTPYDNRLTISHEGASGGGKSEMLEYPHREPDGSLLLGRNVVTGEERKLLLPRGCELRPVTDDMALCHPSLQKRDGKLTVLDAEDAWFVRVNHITRYGTDPHLERVTIQSGTPLLFLNIDAAPGGTALIWEHIEDAPGSPCPNPRVILPRSAVPEVLNGPVTVDVRSFGVRTPPATSETPSYGILGLFHILPPALAWLWRLVAPRGHANPSVVTEEGMVSEGVGSYWPFATGLRVEQANLLLAQILETPRMLYFLCPNQHVGSWEVGFMPQWLMREYLARRGSARFTKKQVTEARCPLLGWVPRQIMIEGQTIASQFLAVETQPEVGPEAYDAGARILTEFFSRELAQFRTKALIPEGRAIIECFLEGGPVEQYEALIPGGTLLSE